MSDSIERAAQRIYEQHDPETHARSVHEDRKDARVILDATKQATEHLNEIRSEVGWCIAHGNKLNDAAVRYIHRHMEAALACLQGDKP